MAKKYICVSEEGFMFAGVEADSKEKAMAACQLVIEKSKYEHKLGGVRPGNFAKILASPPELEKAADAESAPEKA